MFSCEFGRRQEAVAHECMHLINLINYIQVLQILDLISDFMAFNCIFHNCLAE